MALKAEPAASPETDFVQLRPSWYEVDLARRRGFMPTVSSPDEAWG